MKSNLMKRFSEQASIEEFIEESVIPSALNPVITEVPTPVLVEDFGEVLEDPLVEVDQAEVVAGQLDQLAGDVDVITTAPAMESYGRIYTQMVGNLGYDLPSQPGLESFAKTRGGKRALAAQIRYHANHLRRVASLGMEDFVDKVDERLKTLTEEYKTVIKDLDNIKVKIDVPDEQVVVDEKGVWKMLHVDGVLIKSPTYIKEEEKHLRELASQVRQAVTRITTDQASGELFNTGDYELLFNRNIELSGTKVKVKDLGLPDKGREYSNTDIAWIVGWTVFFNIPGLIGSMLFKKATGKEKTKNPRSKQEMLVFIDTVKKMSLIVKDVDSDIAKLTAYINKQGEDTPGYKRDSSPVFQLALFIVQQCTDLAKGSRSLFDKISKG